MQVLELLIFAALAAVVLYQLYAVLGRKVGRQPEDGPQPVLRAAPVLAPAPQPGADVEAAGLAALRAKDPGFDVPAFLLGARSAYEMIVKAFAAGDRQTLAGLVSPQVLSGFEQAIAAREAEGRTSAVEFLHPARADLEATSLEGDVARMKVRFLGEFRNRTKGPEGETVDDRRTAEAWTFERSLSEKNPNWILVRVEAAEA